MGFLSELDRAVRAVLRGDWTGVEGPESAESSGESSELMSISPGERASTSTTQS
jgi:hypothetical protein